MNKDQNEIVALVLDIFDDLERSIDGKTPAEAFKMLEISKYRSGYLHRQ